MGIADQATSVGTVIAKGAQNASTMAPQTSAFDVWSHSYDGLSASMQDFANDPIGSLQNRTVQEARMREAMGPEHWESSSEGAVNDSVSAQLSALGDSAGDISEAQGALATVGASFAFLTGVEQMLSTYLSLIPFPAFPAIRILDMDVGLPHAHSHPPNLTPPNPVPVPLPSTGPVIPIPILSGATQTLINGMPAARCGDMGLGIWCGGYFPMYEVFLGSSNVWIEGARAGRIACDITKHCIFTTPKPSDLPIGPMIGLTCSSSGNVMIGGVPMPSLLSLGIAAAMKGFGKIIRRVQATRLGTKFAGRVQSAAGNAMRRLGVPLSQRNRIHRAICSLTGHPIDIATGKVITEQTDFALPGPIPLYWWRLWCSVSTYHGPFGHGWHGAYDLTLLEDLEKKVVVVRLEDGRAAVFPALELNGEHFHPAEMLLLKRDEVGYALTDRQQLTYRFGPVNRSNGEQSLLQIENRAEATIRFFYNRKGNLKTVVDSAFRRLVIDCDDAGRIVTVWGPHPEDEQQNVTLVRYRYSAENDLVEAIDALDHRYTYAYSSHYLIRETDRNGFSYHFEYRMLNDESWCIRTWGDGGLLGHRLHYDIENKVTELENSLGHRTRHFWDERGIVFMEFNALGHPYVYEFDENCLLISHRDPLGRTHSFKYDRWGNIVERTFPDGVADKAQFDDHGQMVALSPPGGGEWKWHYDDLGRLVEINDPTGRVWKYSFEGRIQHVIEPDGGKLWIEYDVMGNVIRLDDRNGKHYAWHYDQLGRNVRKTGPEREVETVEFDLKGRIVRLDHSSGYFCTYQYDAMDHPIKVIDNATIAEYAYTALGNLSHRRTAGSTFCYLYDTEGKVTQLINDGGERFQFDYDAKGHLRATVGFDGLRTAYTLDAVGRVLRLRSESGREARYSYNGRDWLIRLEETDAEVINYEYDDAGYITEARNRHSVVTLKRDLLLRLVKEERDGHTVESAYDIVAGTILTKTSMGLEMAWQQPPGERTRRVEAQDKFNGQLRIASNLDLYENEIKRTFPGQKQYRREYDELQRLSEWRLLDRGRLLLRRNFEWNAVDQIIQINDFLLGPGEVRYDSFGRTEQISWRHRAADVHKMDAANNVYRSLDLRGRSYGPGGRLHEDEYARYRYDVDGFLTVREERSGATWRYEWSSLGMLSAVIRPDEKRVDFTYDALGRRIGKRYGDTKTEWIWNEHQLIHEIVRFGSSAAGFSEQVISWIYPPGEFSPVGCLIDGEARYFVPDHLEVPVGSLDANGEVLALGSIDLFGNLTTTGDGVDISPHRFPGQYADAETGLYYNRFRYYDPRAGIYISRDPLELFGGVNFFAYVSDPLQFFDPFGLHTADAIVWDTNNGRATTNINNPNARANAQSGRWTSNTQNATDSTFGGPGHTEQRIGDHVVNSDSPNAQRVRQSLAREGTEVRIVSRGQQSARSIDPCNGCQRGMQRLANRTTGVGRPVVYYGNYTHGGTHRRVWTFLPGGRRPHVREVPLSRLPQVCR
jgi:RHS repeat-associated protein